MPKPKVQEPVEQKPAANLVVSAEVAKKELENLESKLDHEFLAAYNELVKRYKRTVGAVLQIQRIKSE